MTKYTFKTDVVNAAGVVTKEHGPIIGRGTTLELDAKNANVKWLLDSGAIEAGEQELEQEPIGNSILDQNAENAIKLIEAEQHNGAQLQVLREYEISNKNRKTVLEAIDEAEANLRNEEE